MDEIAFPLFLPGLRTDRLTKAANAGADAVIIDLEDAVAANQKDQARDQVVEALTKALPSCPLIIRVNANGTTWHDADIAACRDLPIDAVMLPKAETAEACRTVADQAGKLVVALVETALGLHNAVDIATGCAKLAFGSIDYAADLGIAHEPRSLAHARSCLVLAARLAGHSGPWDGVTTTLTDADVCTDDARLAQKMGFGGKLLIHPSQIAPARNGFAPGEAEVLWAQRVVAAAGSDGSAVKLDGAMVDAPVIKRAEAILSRAAALGADGASAPSHFQGLDP